MDDTATHGDRDRSTKASSTAAVVDASLQPVATIRVPVSHDGYRALRRFADRWPDPTLAIEGASGLVHR